uniref:RNA-directed RNA polymerase n=1 Tax=Leviviridae sp. TaxID=2027243 RepID=A0A514D616_9VIRU|nr:MAG: RNA-dependent RNA polymerase [Leviviridae sp.]
MTNPLSADFVDILLTLCEEVATPRSCTVAILVRNGEWDQLALLRVDPNNYLNASSLWRDTIVTELLRKCEDLPTSFDRKGKANELFLASEERCYRSNRRLERLLFPGDYVHTAADVVARSVFERAKKKVLSVLGPFPYHRGLLEGKFGPGATYGDKGGQSTVPDKMSTEPTLTPSAWTSLSSWGSTAWARACAVDGRQPRVVSGNRFSTVPKDCVKFRGIAVEPSINVFYQLTIGKLIRSRLRRLGNNLDVGQDIHRRLACEASTEGHLATLDLSNASDTICKNLVEFLLPPCWYSVLNDLRSPCTLFEGRNVLLEKFSSMGNGFTFELETLIFHCLAAACCELTMDDPFVSVFGDDIIVPTECSKDVIAFLELCGFEINSKKSFTAGFFRESCGGDFFDGVPVRGHYLKELPSTPAQLIAFANGLRRSAGDRFSWVYRAWRRILDRIPVLIRNCRGPSGLGDLVIHDDECRWNFQRRSSIRYIRVWRPIPPKKVRWEHFKPGVILASALYGLGSGDSFRVTQKGVLRLPPRLLGVTPRGGSLSYKLGWVPFS